MRNCDAQRSVIKKIANSPLQVMENETSLSCLSTNFISQNKRWNLYLDGFLRIIFNDEIHNNLKISAMENHFK